MVGFYGGMISVGKIDESEFTQDELNNAKKIIAEIKNEALYVDINGGDLKFNLVDSETTALLFVYSEYDDSGLADNKDATFLKAKENDTPNMEKIAALAQEKMGDKFAVTTVFSNW